MGQQKFKQTFKTLSGPKEIRVVIKYTAVDLEKYPNSILWQDEDHSGCKLSAKDLEVLENESSKGWQEFLEIDSSGNVITITTSNQINPAYGNVCTRPLIIKERQPIKEDD